MAYGNYERSNRGLMQGDRYPNRSGNRDDWTTDDLGYGQDVYNFGYGGGYIPYDRLYGSYAPYPRSERDRYYDRNHRGERDFWDRAGDEVASWFGDEDAERRRERDQHRGRGPRGYRRSDGRINEDVHDRLTDDPRIDASDIIVSVKNGEVTLDGKVHERRAKRIAEDCAEFVPGVTNVQNNLRVQEHEEI